MLEEGKVKANPKEVILSNLVSDTVADMRLMLKPGQAIETNQAGPNEIIIDFKESKITDMSAIDAVNKITERYAKLNKTVHLQHLSADCRTLLKNADTEIDVNILEDPTYKIVGN